MEGTVPLVLDISLDKVGEAKVDEKGKVIQVKFHECYQGFARNYDMYWYIYNEAPQPHVVMRPIPVQERTIND
jgi:hypothetical protein